MATDTRGGLFEPRAGVAPTVRWKARPSSDAPSLLGERAIPRVRHHRVTRCCHCDFCRPQGGMGELRLCISPGHAGDLVIGDQWACGQYQPAVH